MTPPRLSAQPNDIYAALTETNIAGKFHWSIFVATSATDGWKMHATNMPSGLAWRFERVHWCGASTDPSAVLFMKIGAIPPGLDAETLELYLCESNIPMDVVPPAQRGAEPRFTCRVWFHEAVRVLDDAQMFVRCADVEALMRELVGKGCAMQALRLEYGPCYVSTNAVEWE